MTVALQWAIGICAACVLICTIDTAVTLRAGRKVNEALKKFLGARGEGR